MGGTVYTHSPTFLSQMVTSLLIQTNKKLEINEQGNDHHFLYIKKPIYPEQGSIQAVL